MALGTDVFRTFVTTWYSGLLPRIIFSGVMEPDMKNKICSVLAGYVWDDTNPFVAQPQRKVEQLGRIIGVGV